MNLQYLWFASTMIWVSRVPGFHCKAKELRLEHDIISKYKTSVNILFHMPQQNMREILGLSWVLVLLQRTNDQIITLAVLAQSCHYAD